ncbi:MAG: DUF1844 domain-containing protein [Candidatus Omnitrophota bacterium]
MEENVKKKIDESWKEKKASEAVTDKEHSSQKMPEADFKFFLTTLGMQAWIALGKIPNPMTQQIEENKNQAKFIIDTLDVLEKKTKGNLTKEESEILENLLYDLRLNYIDSVKPA